MLLGLLARHGRAVLIAGLAVGIGLPDLALAMRSLIAPLVVFLLFLAVLRLGPEGMRAGMRGLHRAVGITLVLQLALPLAGIAAMAAMGVLAHPLALGVVLVLAAAPITGSPNLTVMAGGDPAPALRQLVVGTALLPLTVLPVFWLIPAFGSPAEVIVVVLRLLGMIVLGGGAALALRHWRIVSGTPRALVAIDGLSALAMGVVVVGLMSAVGPALRDGAPVVWVTLALVMALGLTLQFAGALAARRAEPRLAPSIGVVAGNRNVALFLGALPPALVEDLLLFIGCYQVPMYLTPLLMAAVYRRLSQP
jgi:arsenite transporter